MLPVDVIVVTLVLSPAYSPGVLPPSVSYLVAGPLVGAVMAIGGFFLLRWMNKTQSVNTTPTSLEISSERISSRLPPIQGSTTPREVNVPWPQVQRVIVGGWFLQSMVIYQRGQVVAAQLPGIQGDRLWLTRENASKVEEAWTLWKRDHGPSEPLGKQGGP